MTLVIKCYFLKNILKVIELMHITRKNICHRVKKKITYFLIELSLFFLTQWHVFIIF